MGNDNYTQCTVCHEHFHKEDDIVVCPECGAPAHRSCFVNNGECAFCHGKGGVTFKDPKEILKGKEAGVPGMVTCPGCGELNHPENTTCNKCGQPLKTPQKNAGPFAFPGSDGAGAFTETTFEKMMLGGMHKTDTIEEVSVEDIATYVGPNAGYYLSHFRVFASQKRKASFSFSAFFFPPLFYLYRKMWGLGALCAAISFFLQLPGLLNMFATAGIPLGQLSFLENLVFINNPTLTSVLFYIFAALSGLFANYIYKQKVIRSIKGIKEKNPKNYSELLTKKGGISRVVSIIAVIVVIAALWI